MADVQLEHGHVRIANRLVEAILAADELHGTQVRILLALVRLTYGWKRRTVQVGLEQLARYAGVAYGGGFRRDLEALVRNGVVLEVVRGYPGVPTVYAIQKDYEQWGEYAVAPAKLGMRWAERPAHADDRLPASAPTGAMPLEPSAPTGTKPLPLQGQNICPHRDKGTGANALQDSELPARKERKERERKATSSSPRATDVRDPSLAVVLAGAANRGITERWGEQLHPIRHSAGSTLKAAERIAQAGVPGDFARDAIYSYALTCDLAEPPQFLGYFTQHVIDRWRAEEERRAEQDAAESLGAPRLIVTTGPPRRPSGAGGDRPGARYPNANDRRREAVQRTMAASMAAAAAAGLLDDDEEDWSVEPAVDGGTDA